MSCREFVIRYDGAEATTEERVQDHSLEQAVVDFMERYIVRHPECLNNGGIDLPSPIEIREVGAAEWKTAEVSFRMKPSITVRIV